MDSVSLRAQVASLAIVVALLGSTSARAQSLAEETQAIFSQGHSLVDQGHFVIGFGGAFGLELNGPKLVLGWAWQRAQVSVALSGGALVLPIGPGAMVEATAEWVALPTSVALFGNQSSVGAVVGAHLGAKVTALSHPAFHVEGIGQYANNEGVCYGFASAGFPEIVEFGAGERLVPHNGVGPYGELRFGIPMLVNGEIGMTGLPIR